MDATPAIALQDEAEFWVTPDFAGARLVDVTVVIPSYNAEATLERALRSALDQGMRDLEVIVVDDASRDFSWALVSNIILEDARVRGIRNKQNQGKPIGMNRAIALARGRWIAVLDADDWFAPDRLATLIALGERRQADMVADNQSFHDARARQMVGTAWPSLARDWVLTFDDFLAGSDAYETFSFGMLKPVMRRDFIRRTGLAYEAGARNGQDFFYLLQFFLLGGKAAICDRPLYCYTQPFGAISRQWSHGARRRYDFQTACDINRRYLAGSLDRLTPSQAVRLECRNRQLECLEHYYSAKERLAATDLPKALAFAAKRPAILSYLLRSLSRKYLHRSGSSVVQRLARRARARMCD
ncbi:MAG TPA: glycosyltransferase family 2 protein [Rhizomicrobium sp.]|nr:glycosyltransferase family 2 protein [Rhizomicrobium sp.]